MISNKLALPVAKRMRAGSTQFERQPFGYVTNRFAQQRYIFIGFVNILANVSTHLYYSLVHFGLYLILDTFLTFLHNFLVMAFKLICFRVEHHVLLFDP